MATTQLPLRFSTQTIAALTEVVTGGSFQDVAPSIGHYRSGPKLERFFAGLGMDLRIGSGSRVPAVQALLRQSHEQPDGRDTIIRVLEACADPREYFSDESKLDAVVEYMNKRLRFDGVELRMVGNVYKVVTLVTHAAVASALKKKADALELSSVNADFERAITEADRDPSDAITAACAIVESVCKCILDEMTIPYPRNKDIKGLVGEVAKHLNLSPGRNDLPAEWEQDIRTILSGLFNVIGGIGSLRTHAGDAHGKGMRSFPVDARIARLAIHAASTVSLFYIETWQRKSLGSVSDGTAGQ
ncbi:MAG: abortive infection family protein [Phycisphaeraceae bacterium]|nr:abortive infection family protein [Phycisphaeraceae bacterium]